MSIQLSESTRITHKTVQCSECHCDVFIAGYDVSMIEDWPCDDCYRPPDTCDGYVSEGPYCCLCDCCTAASEEPMPEPPVVNLWHRVLRWFR